MSTAHLMACHDCDLLQQIPSVPEGSAALCRRCGAVLIENKPKSFQRPLALLFAGVILFVMFNAFPFLTFKKAGLEHQTHVISGIRQLADQGMGALAVLVAINLLIVPGLHLLASLYVLVPVSMNRKVPGMFRVFRYLRLLQPWHMVEIFMLGVLVSLVKLAKMAQIVPGIAVYSLTVFIFVFAAASAAIDPHEIWERWGRFPVKKHGLTARKAGLIACSVCHLLCPAPPPSETNKPGRCPRCAAALHSRKPNSIARTWALVIAACIFYIPANVLPMTTVTSLGRTQSDTIMSGVIYFVQSGSWPIALVIFIASIFVPLLKLLILTYLLISVQHRSHFRPKDRTRLYLITEAVGRWSMLDIFVITILVALVNLGALATIQAGPAALYFAAVVVITMIAAMSFDPRLIWDAKEKIHE